MSEEPKPAAELSALNAHGLGMRVSFYWRGDRYFHRIDALDGYHVRPLLESLEGDEHSQWPVSPPLQHVNVSWIVSDSERGHVAMLVGAAGKSHWSMCVAVRDRECRPRGVEPAVNELYLDESMELGSVQTELIFDVACRVSDSPKWLGSSYRALASPIAVSDKWQCACVPTGAPGCVIQPEGGRLELDTVSAALPILRCSVTDTEVTASPATVRWRYAVRWSIGNTLQFADELHLKR